MKLNNSFNNNTFSFPEYNYAEKVSIASAMFLCTVLAVPGNVIVILVVTRVHTMKTSTNFLLLNLCIADLLIAVASLPFITIDLYITNEWIFGTFMCKLVSFSQSVSTKASILFLMALSMERYLTICQPNRRVVAKVRIKILSMVLWIVATGATLPLFIYKTTIVFQGMVYCIESWSLEAGADYSYMVFTLFYVVPLLLMAALYAKIGQKLYQSSLRTKGMRHPNVKGRAALASKQRLTKICMFIILSFALSWVPAHVLTLLYYSSDISLDYNKLAIIYPITSFLSYLNCALNPHLYCFMSQNFRNALFSEWKHFTTKRKRKSYGRMPGVFLGGCDSIMCAMPTRLQSSVSHSCKEQGNVDQENTEKKHKKCKVLEHDVPFILFESAL